MQLIGEREKLVDKSKNIQYLEKYIVDGNVAAQKLDSYIIDSKNYLFDNLK